MRGTILGYDAAAGTGAINDLTGGRLKFTRDAWRSPGEPVPGRLVDFEVVDGAATDQRLPVIHKNSGRTVRVRAPAPVVNS